MGLSDLGDLLAAFLPGIVDEHTEELIEGVRALADRARNHPSERKGVPEGMPKRSEMVMTPAEAFFGRVEHVPLEASPGRVAAEAVALCPPGIPWLAPGERVTDTHVACLRLDLKAGTFLMSLTDMRLRTPRVVA